MVKIACILDEFSYECFKYEAILIQLDVDNWYSQINKSKPDILFVESAWRGLNNRWINKIGGIEDSQKSPIKKVVDLCKQLNIPTVFWNKEDPVHFGYFIETARLFDYIFTTDDRMIHKYKEKVNHDKVYQLLFAAQPRIHNPISKDCEKLGNIAFAGSWYWHNHPIRRKNMDIILKPALKYDVAIYDRMYRYRYYSEYRFPEIYSKNIMGCVDYKDIPRVYKSYRVFMNVNDVNYSGTMFSRRVFEILACGTNIISSYSLGIERIFPGIVQLSTSEEETEKCIQVILKNREYRDRLSLMGQREVFSKHTYRNRLETILETVGINYEKSNNYTISFISVANDINEIKRILHSCKRQLDINKEIIVLVNKSAGLKEDIDKIVDDELAESKLLFVEIADMKYVSDYLNKSLNRAIGDYVCFINPKDYYSRYFALDTVNAFKYADADIVGKNTYYRIDRKDFHKVVIGDNVQNRYVTKLNLHSSIFRKEIFKNIKFSDIYCAPSRFIEQCNRRRIKMYSTDRFGYISTEENFDVDGDKKIEEQNLIDGPTGEEDFFNMEAISSCGCTGPQPPERDLMIIIILLFLLLFRCEKCCCHKHCKCDKKCNEKCDEHEKEKSKDCGKEKSDDNEQEKSEDIDNEYDKLVYDSKRRGRKHHKKSGKR